MKNKKLIIAVGLIALAGVGFYFWNRSKKSTDTDTDEKSVGGARTSGATNTSSGASDSESNSVTDESTEQGSSGTNIKDLKGKEKREFRKETRDICAEKYGKGVFNKKYNDCKKRVKGGGVAFTGDFDDFQNDYIDFKGQISNQFMFSNFDNDLDLDI
jgi:hypothetical protein